MDLGQSLRSARERAGLSLGDIVARTKIPEKTLRAIERNDFDKVPAGIFARSFIGSYAREVGVDPDAAVAEFRAITEPVVEPKETQREPVKHEVPASGFHPEFLASPPRWGYFLATAALLISVVVINRSLSSSGAPRSDRLLTAGVAPAPAPPAAPALAPVETPRPIATSAAPIQIELRPQGLCWIRAVVDGQVAFARLMYAGETETLTGQHQIEMRVGDPSTLSYSINGQPGESLGSREIPVTVRFGADGKVSRVAYTGPREVSAPAVSPALQNGEGGHDPR